MKHYGSMIAEAIMDNRETMLQLMTIAAGGTSEELRKKTGSLRDKIADIMKEGAQAWQEVLFGGDNLSLGAEEAVFRIYIMKRLLDAYEKAIKAAENSALRDAFAGILDNVGEDIGFKFRLEVNKEEGDDE